VPGGAWEAATRLPSAFAETTAAEIDCRLYIPGGLDTKATGGGSRIHDLDSLLVYEPMSDAYFNRAPMPEARNHPGVAALDGKLYVSGGYLQVTGKSNLWSYDPKTDAWTVLADMPGSRAAHVMIGFAGKLWAIGGVILGQRDWTPMWVYDVATDSWSTDYPALPTQREHLTGVELGARFYIIGGRYLSNLATVEIYDPEMNNWIKGPDRPTPASAMSATVFGGVIHTAGGEDINELRTIGAHEGFDTATLTWSKYADLPTRRHGTFGGEVEGRWYVMGGGRAADLSVSDIVEVWTP
jgi:N-acetylneuraminic acid mutarotase